MKIAIRCTACQAAYLFDESEAPAHGDSMRCSECGATFRVRLQFTAPGAGTAPAPRTQSGAANAESLSPEAGATQPGGRRKRVTLTQGSPAIGAAQAAEEDSSEFPAERTKPGIRPRPVDSPAPTAPAPAALQARPLPASSMPEAARPKATARPPATTQPQGAAHVPLPVPAKAPPTRTMNPAPPLPAAAADAQTRDMAPLPARHGAAAPPAPVAAPRRESPKRPPIGRALDADALHDAALEPRRSAQQDKGPGSEWYLNALDEKARAKPAPKAPRERESGYSLGSSPLKRAPSATGEWEALPPVRSNILARDVEITEDVPAITWAPSEAPRRRARWILAILVFLSGSALALYLVSRDGPEDASDAMTPDVAALSPPEESPSAAAGDAGVAEDAAPDGERGSAAREAAADDASPEAAADDDAHVPPEGDPPRAAAPGTGSAAPAEAAADTPAEAAPAAEPAETERSAVAAAEAPERAVARPPREPTRAERLASLTRDARAAENAGSFDRALSLWSDAEQLDRGSSEIQLGIARTYMGMGRPELAAARADRLLQSNPRFAPAILLRADALRSQGQREEAIRAYRDVLRAAPGSASARTATRRLESLGATP